jgi:hypothetical protein
VFPGYDLDGLTNDPNQHTYRTGGFGSETYSFMSVLMTDGMTGEGNLFRPRWELLGTAFKLYQKFPNKVLMRETLDLADEYLPPDATAAFFKGPHNQSGDLMLLAFSLETAKSEQDWKTALDNFKLQVASAEAPAK